MNPDTTPDAPNPEQVYVDERYDALPIPKRDGDDGPLYAAPQPPTESASEGQLTPVQLLRGWYTGTRPVPEQFKRLSFAHMCDLAEYFEQETEVNPCAQNSKPKSSETPHSSDALTASANSTEVCKDSSITLQSASNAAPAGPTPPESGSEQEVITADAESIDLVTQEVRAYIEACEANDYFINWEDVQGIIRSHARRPVPVVNAGEKRREICPQCGAKVIQPRDTEDYCEECGWPDENREPMRIITDHKLNGLNDALEIKVLDEPGQGGACHEYAISFFRTEGDHQYAEPEAVRISFQNGPIKESGVNGISGEALVAIVIDRLRSFQAGPFACRENAVALTQLEDGLMWLQKRTRDRLSRGVEGTNQK